MWVSCECAYVDVKRESGGKGNGKRDGDGERDKGMREGWERGSVRENKG